MNKQGKLVKKKSSPAATVTKAETKKKQSPRNPLKQLNRSAPEIIPRGSSSSTSSASNNSLQRSKSLSNPNCKCSSTPPFSRSRAPNKSLVRTISENPKASASQKTQRGKAVTDLLQWRNLKKSSFEGSEKQALGGDSSGSVKKRPSLAGKPTGVDFMTVQVRGIDQNAKFLPGSCSASSPDKIHSGFTEEVNPELSFRVDLESNGGTPMNKISFSSRLIQTPNKAEEGIGEQSNTPSTTTPPIQTSISPEILCGTSLISTPACFAAGYVVVGVSDKRKCRPRGILTVGGVLESGVNNENFGFSLNACVDSVVSLAPPLADASMHWLSPPSESIGKGVVGNGSPEFELSDAAITAEEASVHWLVSPCDEDGEDGIHGNVSAISVSEAPMHSPGLEVRGTLASFVNEFGGLVSPMTTVVKSTPSPGHGFWRNRTIDSNSGGTMSPSCWPGCKAIVESSSPLTGGIGDENVICTPSSDSDTNNRSGLACKDEVGRLDQQLELASTREALQTISLSMHSGAVKNSPIEFSVDLTQFQSSGQDEVNRIGGFGGRERSLSSSGFGTDNNLRVSWREGLVSRIFEVDELSCCRWLSDGEEDVECLENGDVQSDFQFHISPNVCTSASKCSFGSIEIVNGETGDSEIETKRPPLGPISCVESISTEGGGLVASDDSDWTLCYKNHLFEV